MGYEKYFQKGARIFAYQTEPTRQTLPRFMEEKDAFVDTFYKTQALSRQYGNQDATYHRSWNDTNVYSNVYDYETYTKTEIKVRPLILCYHQTQLLMLLLCRTMWRRYFWRKNQKWTSQLFWPRTDLRPGSWLSCDQITMG
jgi:hypothetical protein